MRFYLLLLLLLPFHCLSQHAVISATKMNVLYVGVENPVSFAMDNANCRDLDLVVENGIAKRTSDCDYSITVTKPGSTLIFIVKGNDTLYKTLYRIKNIPDPVISWGHDDPYWFQLDSLRSQNQLQAITKHFNFDAIFSIVSFEITVMRNKKLSKNKKIYCSDCLKKIEGEYYETVFSCVNNGADFNNSLKEFIQTKLAPGDKVFIEEIKVMAPDSRIRSLNSINFIVQ